MLRGKTDPAPP